MILTAKNLTVKFKNGYKGIQNMNFRIGNGIYGLLGENGAGKTTLMRVLTTILIPTSGQIMFENIPYAEKNFGTIQKKIGYLPQELNLYPNLTVQETLMYLGSMSGIEKKTCEKNNTVLSFEKSTNSLLIRTRSSGSSPVVGSSTIKSSGSFNKACTNPTRLFIPPDNCLFFFCLCSSKPVLFK